MVSLGSCCSPCVRLPAAAEPQPAAAAPAPQQARQQAMQQQAATSAQQQAQQRRPGPPAGHAGRAAGTSAERPGLAVASSARGGSSEVPAAAGTALPAGLRVEYPALVGCCAGIQRRAGQRSFKGVGPCAAWPRGRALKPRCSCRRRRRPAAAATCLTGPNSSGLALGGCPRVLEVSTHFERESGNRNPMGHGRPAPPAPGWRLLAAGSTRRIHSTVIAGEVGVGGSHNCGLAEHPACAAAARVIAPVRLTARFDLSAIGARFGRAVTVIKQASGAFCIGAAPPPGQPQVSARPKGTWPLLSSCQGAGLGGGGVPGGADRGQVGGVDPAAGRVSLLHSSSIGLMPPASRPSLPAGQAQ